MELKPCGLREFLLWIFRRRWRFRVTGNSMFPLLKPGEEVLVNPRAYQHTLPQPGDIVVAQHPFQTNLRVIKRIVAVIDNKQFILHGDNATESSDSRTFGPLSIDHILGQVTSRF